MYIVKPRRESIQAKKMIIQVQEVGVEDLGEEEKYLSQYFVPYSDKRQTLFLSVIPKKQQLAAFCDSSGMWRYVTGSAAPACPCLLRNHCKEGGADLANPLQAHTMVCLLRSPRP